jgi:hypothetical protein
MTQPQTLSQIRMPSVFAQGDSGGDDWRIVGEMLSWFCWQGAS